MTYSVTVPPHTHHPSLTTFMMDFSHAIELPSNWVQRLSCAGDWALCTARRHSNKPGGTSSVNSETCSSPAPPPSPSPSLPLLSPTRSAPRLDRFSWTLKQTSHRSYVSVTISHHSYITLAHVTLLLHHTDARHTAITQTCLPIESPVRKLGPKTGFLRKFKGSVRNASHCHKTQFYIKMLLKKTTPLLL